MSNDIADFAQAHFTKLGWLDRSGAFLYTGPDSVRPGDTLIMGTNPGGSIEQHKLKTLDAAIAEFRNLPPGWSAWFDEGGWGSKRIFEKHGSAPLQRHVADVLMHLGYPRDAAKRVCSTELIFLTHL
jgi:hypothetical protein